MEIFPLFHRPLILVHIAEEKTEDLVQNSKQSGKCRIVTNCRFSENIWKFGGRFQRVKSVSSSKEFSSYFCSYILILVYNKYIRG